MRNKAPNNWFILAFGIIYIVFGFCILYTPKWTSIHGMVFDVSEYKIPVAILSVGIGIYATWTSLVHKTQDNMVMMICDQCLTPVNSYEAANKTCPKCGGELEPLEGFYERHPELKDEE